MPGMEGPHAMEDAARCRELMSAPEGELLHEIALLKEQLATRDEQIADLQQRCREREFVAQRARWSVVQQQDFV